MTSCNHVAYQDGSVTFYAPEFFSRGFYYNTNIPIIIDDLYSCIEKSKRVCLQFYGNRVSQLFWKNHPIERVCVLGLVVNDQWKELLRSKEEFLLITLDDCSSSRNKDPIFLVCKCSKDVFLGCGLMGSLSGNRVRVYGTICFKYCELQVEYLELCNNLSIEISHWEQSEKTRQQMNIPWEIDEQMTAGSDGYRRVDSSDQKSFIRHLESGRIIGEPYIINSNKNYPKVCQLSPCEPSSNIELNFGLEAEPSDENNIVITSSEESEKSLEGIDDIPMDMDVVLYNITQAKNTLSKCLINFKGQKISKHHLLKMRPVENLIIGMCELRFNQKNAALVKPFEQMKFEILSEVVDKLCDCGLLNLEEHNIINIEPLKKLYRYCWRRLLALLKLKCLSCAVDHEYVVLKLNCPGLSKRAVIDTFKVALKDASGNDASILKNWWIEMNSEKSSVIHLEYQKNR